ncbi:MAG: OmpA family protein [Prevotella sp.]|nr:OmpA family protein [Prevotella sp.]
MKTKRLMTLAASMLLLGGTASAQEQSWQSFSYVEAQGGLQLTSTNAPMDKLMMPTAALSFGHYFTPVVGARLHVNAWQSKSGFKDLDKYYKWKYVTPSVDLMLNLSNLFCQNQDRFLNVILLGGVGLNYAWDNDELKDLGMAPQRIPLAWDDNRLSHNLRAGLRFETNQSKPLGLSLELNANSLDDRFNSKVNDQDDWQFTAMLGLNFRFGYKGKKEVHIPVTRQIEETIWEEVPVVKKVKKTQPYEIEKPVQLHKEVFYDIRVSDNVDPSVIQAEVADFMKKNPQSKVTIVGYADKGTGNARLNKMYAQRRAETFKKDLIEKHGVNPDMLIVDSKGDTVQPFPDNNDKNRCVIIDAEGKMTVKEFREIEVEETVMEKREKKVMRTITE